MSAICARPCPTCERRFHRHCEVTTTECGQQHVAGRNPLINAAENKVRAVHPKKDCSLPFCELVPLCFLESPGGLLPRKVSNFSI